MIVKVDVHDGQTIYTIYNIDLYAIDNSARVEPLLCYI